MTIRRRAVLALAALLASTVLAGCDWWEPVVCVGKQPDIAVCV